MSGISRLRAENTRFEIELRDAREFLRRVMEALDREVEVGGPVPFDPDDIREYLSR